MAESVLHPPEILVSSDNLIISRWPDKAMLDLRLSPVPETQQHIQNAIGCILPADPNSFVTSASLRIGWLGPDEWVMTGARDAIAQAEANLALHLTDVHHSLVDISGNRSCFSVAGADAVNLVAVGCSLDFAGPTFESDLCVQTLLARAQVMIFKQRETQSFEIYPRRSFSSYLSLWLQTAAREFIDQGNSETIF